MVEGILAAYSLSGVFLQHGQQQIPSIFVHDHKFWAILINLALFVFFNYIIQAFALENWFAEDSMF